jgi:hypothetical protein
MVAIAKDKDLGKQTGQTWEALGRVLTSLDVFEA